MAKQPNGSPILALTFDDVLLKPGLSDVLPSEVDIRTRVTREIRGRNSDSRSLGPGKMRGRDSARPSNLTAITDASHNLLC